MIRWSMQLLCLLLIVGAGLTWLSLRSAQPRTTPITLDELKQCAELVTLQVPVQQLAEAHVRGYTGGIRCLVLAYGQAWIATDLDQARLETDDHGVTLYLMQPRVIACTLDYTRSSVVFIARRGAWIILPGEAGESTVIGQALRQAEQAMADMAGDPLHIASARRKAEQVINAVFADQPLRIMWTDTGR